MNENRVIDERREPDSPTVARLNKRARRTLAEGVPYLAGPLGGACACLWAGGLKDSHPGRGELPHYNEAIAGGEVRVAGDA